MKILFSSHFFPPSVGGLEEVGALLAGEFARRGHEVTVVTQTPETTPLPYEVRRRPGAGELLALTRRCDVVFHNNISLRTAWPLCLVRRPWVVAHHTWIARPDGRRAFADRIKHAAARHAVNIAVSDAVAADLAPPAATIPNPYRDDLFRIVSPPAERPRNVICVARLVTDKGVDLLLDALAAMAKPPRATVVGDGPEKSRLEEQARRAGLDVVFTGVRRGAELAALMNEHRAIAIPSRWEEPFGIVALEGLACGCVPVAARSGGLPEAVGPCGILFKKGDSAALAAALETALAAETPPAGAAEHLARHRASPVAEEYLDVIERAVATGGGR